jgi:hypothetical protein
MVPGTKLALLIAIFTACVVFFFLLPSIHPPLLTNQIFRIDLNKFICDTSLVRSSRLCPCPWRNTSNHPKSKAKLNQSCFFDLFFNQPFYTQGVHLHCSPQARDVSYDVFV